LGKRQKGKQRKLQRARAHKTAINSLYSGAPGGHTPWALLYRRPNNSLPRSVWRRMHGGSHKSGCGQCIAAAWWAPPHACRKQSIAARRTWVRWSFLGSSQEAKPTIANIEYQSRCVCAPLGPNGALVASSERMLRLHISTLLIVAPVGAQAEAASSKALRPLLSGTAVAIARWHLHARRPSHKGARSSDNSFQCLSAISSLQLCIWCLQKDQCQCQCKSGRVW
jgi:hypothetical protein